MTRFLFDSLVDAKLKELQKQTEIAKKQGWLMVFPAGIWEKRVSDGNLDSTWNCGTPQDDDYVCLSGTKHTQCLESCQKIGKCNGKCN